MLVWSVFHGVKRNWFLSADVSVARTCHSIKNSCELDANNDVNMGVTNLDDNCIQTLPIPLPDGPTEKAVVSEMIVGFKFEKSIEKITEDADTVMETEISSGTKKKKKKKKGSKSVKTNPEQLGVEQTDNGTFGFRPPSTHHIPQETGKEEGMTNHEGKDVQVLLDSSTGDAMEKVRGVSLRNEGDSVILTQTEQTLKKITDRKTQSSAGIRHADFPAVEIENLNQVDNSNENTKNKYRNTSKKRKLTASKVQEDFPVENQQVGFEALATKENLISSVNSLQEGRHVDSSQVLSSKTEEKLNNMHGIAENTYDLAKTFEMEGEGINFKQYFVPGQLQEKVDSGDKVKNSTKSNHDMETSKTVKNNVSPSVSNSTELQSSIKSLENKKAENISRRKGSSRSIGDSAQNSDHGEKISNSFRRSSGASENGAKGSRPSEMCETTLQKPDEILAASSLLNNSSKFDHGEMISNSFKRSSGASENGVKGSIPSEICETALQIPDDILAASSLPNNSSKSRRKGSSSSIGESAQNSDHGEMISNSFRRSSVASENEVKVSIPSEICETTLQKPDVILAASSLLNKSPKSRKKGSSRSIGESAQNSDRGEMISNSFRRSSVASEHGAKSSIPSEICETTLLKPNEILAASSFPNNSSKSCRKGSSRSIGESAQYSDRGEMISNSFRRSSGASENGAKGSRPSEMCETTLQKPNDILAASSRLNKTNRGSLEKSTSERSDIFPGKKGNKMLQSGTYVTNIMPMRTPQKKSLLTKPGAIFLDNSGESSEDENGTMHSDASTLSPSDSSSMSGHSVEESDLSQDSTRNGSNDADGRSAGRKNISKLDLSASKDDITMDMILRSSKRFKKAKLLASQNESEPIDFDPDSLAS